MKDDLEIAAEYQSKFRFYFVALVFTFLAASVQSAPLAKMTTCNSAVELLGWVSLLISGLASLSFLEFSAVIHGHNHTIKNTDTSEERKTIIAEVLEGIESMSSIKYKIAKSAFVIGLVAVMVSRGINGLS